MLLAGGVAGIVAGLVFVSPAHATVMGIAAGDLIKLQDDHDPNTHEDEALYFLDRDWWRRPFLNQQVYASWYRDFSGVKELTKAEMSEFRIGKPVVYRPGTRLVKIPSVPKVYAVEPGGILRWIQGEAVAQALYGPDWARRVDDVSEAFFFNYREGAPIIAPAWPTGTFVRRASDATLFYLNGFIKRRVTPETAVALRLAESDIVTTASDLSEYADGVLLATADWNLMDTAQDSLVEPSVAPQLAVDDSALTVEKGDEAVLYVLHLSANQPVLTKTLRLTLSGDLRSNGQPNLTDLHWVDGAGNDLFGINQLPTSDAAPVSLSWSGAYLVPGGTVAEMKLVAKVSSSAQSGAAFSVQLERNALVLADGGNDSRINSFAPFEALPAVSIKVKSP